MTDLMTTRQAAAVLGYNDTSVCRLLRHGRLPGVKIGKTWYAQADAVRELASQNEAERQSNNRREQERAKRRQLRQAGAVRGKPDITTNRVAELYQTMTIRDVAARLGISRDAVRARLQRAGVNTRPRGQPAPPVTDAGSEQERRAALLANYYASLTNCPRFCRWRPDCLDLSVDEPCPAMAGMER